MTERPQTQSSKYMNSEVVKKAPTKCMKTPFLTQLLRKFEIWKFAQDYETDIFLHHGVALA